MAQGANEPPVEQEQGDSLLLRLEFADGTQLSVDPREAAAMLRGYAVPAPMFRSRRVYDLVVEYAKKHAEYRRRGSVAEPDIDEWDRSFMERVDDTDTLNDLFLVDLVYRAGRPGIVHANVEAHAALRQFVLLTNNQSLRDHPFLLRISS